MKFSCDRCGKKYATAETPAPGRVYKLKCKACGHLIVVKTPASAASGAVESKALATPPPQGIVESDAPPREPTPTPFQVPAGTPVPKRDSEPTAEISMLQTGELSKPADAGYVDIFAEGAPSAESPGPAAPEQDDPFAKAARGSLPEHFGAQQELSDPFADMREELAGPAEPSPAVEPEPRSVPPPAAFGAPPPRAEDKKKSGLPVALIGVGSAVVLGIVVVVALTSGKKADKPPAPAPVAAPTPPAPPPPPVAAPAPSPAPHEPVKAEPTLQPKPEPKAREERRVARAEPKPEPKPKAKPEPPPPPPPPPPPRVTRAEPERPVQLPDAASALSPEAVQRVVSSSRRAFENCIVDAARRGTDTKFDGRKVALRLNVNPNGVVTYPTLDDVTLNRTELGECLKAAARLMVFPKFQGDVFHVEVPLTLRGG